MNYQIGIIGYGIVGQAVEYGFKGEDIHIYDKFKDRFAAEAANMIYNGPFMLTEWVHGAKLTLDKNPNYWIILPART